MLGSNQNSFGHKMDGWILNPSKLNEPSDPRVVAPMPSLTLVTTETTLGLLIPALGNK